MKERSACRKRNFSWADIRNPSWLLYKKYPRERSGEEHWWITAHGMKLWPAAFRDSACAARWGLTASSLWLSAEIAGIFGSRCVSSFFFSSSASSVFPQRFPPFRTPVPSPWQAVALFGVCPSSGLPAPQAASVQLQTVGIQAAVHWRRLSPNRRPLTLGLITHAPTHPRSCSSTIQTSPNNCKRRCKRWLRLLSL